MKKKPTIKHERMFKGLVENINLPPGQKPKTLKVIAQEAGYGKIASQPSRIIGTIGFQMLLNKHIDDEEMLSKLREIYLGEDKRSALTAIDMGLKLKDRYPAGKLKIQAYSESLLAIRDNGNEEAQTEAQ